MLSNAGSLLGQTLAGRYQIRELLGAGGMGAVYRAHQLTLRRDVAIKVLPGTLTDQPGYLERFNREAEIAARLEHPHIISIYDYGSENGITYVVMRLLTGSSLHERIRRYTYAQQDRPSLQEISTLLTMMAGALDYAHSSGVIHRDIKPSNVMLDERGTPYITDFGIAVLAESTSGLTQTGALIGTPLYMAPEMWQGLPLTPAVDQYALGAVIYQLLTGRQPFESETPYQMMVKHLQESVPPAHTLRPGTPAAISDVVNRALAKQASERYVTIGGFAEAFAAAAKGISEPDTHFFTQRTSAPRTPDFAPPTIIDDLRTAPRGAAEEREKKAAEATGTYPQPAAPSAPRVYAPSARRAQSPSWLFPAIGVVALGLAGVLLLLTAGLPNVETLPGLMQPILDNAPLIAIIGLSGVGVFFLGSAVMERRRAPRPPSSVIIPPGDGDLHVIRHEPPIPRVEPIAAPEPINTVAQRTEATTQPEVPVEAVPTPPPPTRDATTTFTGLTQGLWIAHYRLDTRLDKGERSRVYQAHDTRLDRPVAIKALNAYSSSSERSERFKREAQLLGKLHHAHIVPLYDYGVLNDINYTVMPLLTGGSLEDKLRDTVSPSQALAVARPLGEALDYIHSNGVIHRDLKAGNILFGEQNKLYLVDFGIAKILDPGQQALTAVGQVVGTPETMAPEQWVGETLTPAADQYTFAALVYRMLTGEMPFKADSPYRYMLQHLRETPPLPSSRRSELPGAVDAVLLKALGKDPAERYPSINLFVDALERALRGADSARTEGHIFLSYSRADGDYARSVAGYLRGHGFEVWMDDKIEPSEEWWPNIVAALDQCCAFVVIMSPSSAESRWVARETLLADEKRKPAFPLLLRGKAFPIYVATQYADVSDGSMPNEVFIRRLAGAMGREAESG